MSVDVLLVKGMSEGRMTEPFGGRQDPFLGNVCYPENEGGFPVLSDWLSGQGL